MKKLEQEKIDDDMWAQGLYFYNAMQTALAEFGAGLSGKHSKAKYLEKSLHEINEEKKLHEQGLEKEYKYLSDEERQKAELEKAMSYFNSFDTRFNARKGVVK